MSTKPRAIKVRLTDEDHEKLKVLQETYKARTLSETVRNLIQYTTEVDAQFHREVVRPTNAKLDRLTKSGELVNYIQSGEYSADIEALTTQYLELHREKTESLEPRIAKLIELARIAGNRLQELRKNEEMHDND